MALIFIFLDGVGLANRSTHNPFAITPMTQLRAALGSEFFIEDAAVRDPEKLFIPIDAGLGVSGEGQSGTGQFSIYTGRNGSELFGRHYGPYLPTPIRPLLAEENIFRKLNQRGMTAAYANAYPKRMIETCLDLRTKGKIRSSVLFEAAALEGITLRSSDELKRREAVSGDIIARWWKKNPNDGDPDVNEITPEDAARDLLRLATTHDAAFYEFFLTDLAGHRRIQTPSPEIVERLDGFLSTLITELPKETSLVLTADHGNFENNENDRHTQNPVPLLALGKAATSLRDVTSIADILPALLGGSRVAD
jgi:2,3-bisphosphoglycerate-independent phosphoglycerate mutase